MTLECVSVFNFPATWAATFHLQGFNVVVRAIFGVTLPLVVRSTLLRQMDMGSLTRTQIWVRAIHTKGGQQQNKSAQELTRRDFYFCQV